MDKKELREILLKTASGELSVDDAVMKFKISPFEDIGFAKIDHHRGIRQGIAEVIYGAGKSDKQIIDIANSMVKNGQKTILVTRIETETAAALSKLFDVTYNEMGKIAVIGEMPEPDIDSEIVIATGGTSDMGVAEEAAITAEALGNRVTRLYDVGVSGIHRLLSYSKEIMSARVIIAVAGMEGALASVIGGLADCPVIAVPTSVGYGTAFGGVTAQHI